MSPIFTRTLFAGASMALTFVMVAASAPATAQAAPAEARRMTVQVADLNLASAAGRQTFERRLAVAAERVCPEDANRFETARCRAGAIAQARQAVAAASRTAS